MNDSDGTHHFLDRLIRALKSIDNGNNPKLMYLVFRRRCHLLWYTSVISKVRPFLPLPDMPFRFIKQRRHLIFLLALLAFTSFTFALSFLALVLAFPFALALVALALSITLELLLRWAIVVIIIVVL